MVFHKMALVIRIGREPSEMHIKALNFHGFKIYINLYG